MAKILMLVIVGDRTDWEGEEVSKEGNEEKQQKDFDAPWSLSE